MGLRGQEPLQEVRHHQQAALLTWVSKPKRQDVSLMEGCPTQHVPLVRSLQMQRYRKFAHLGIQVQYVTYRPVKKIKRMLSMAYNHTMQVNTKPITSSP